MAQAEEAGCKAGCKAEHRGCLYRLGSETLHTVLVVGFEQKPTKNKTEEEEAPPDGTTQYLMCNAVLWADVSQV